MMWSHKAFGIYMGDVMASERDASREHDVMVQVVAREQAIERAAACAEAAQSTPAWIDTTRTARAGRTRVAGAARS